MAVVKITKNVFFDNAELIQCHALLYSISSFFNNFMTNLLHAFLNFEHNRKKVHGWNYYYNSLIMMTEPKTLTIIL